MARIEALLSRRLELAENYRNLLQDHPQVGLPRTTRHGKHSYQTFCVYLNRRDEVMRELRQIGIEVQIGSYALQIMPPFAPGPHCRPAGDLAASRYAFEHCLALPLYHDLQPEDQQLVVRELTRRL